MIFDHQIFISINIIERSYSLKVKFTDFSTNRRPNPIYNFLLVINTNLDPISHRFQVIVDYWSNLRFRQMVPFFNTLVRDKPVHSGSGDLAKINQKRTFIVWCKIRFDILNRLGTDHECDTQTDRQTEPLLALTTLTNHHIINTPHRGNGRRPQRHLYPRNITEMTM